MMFLILIQVSPFIVLDVTVTSFPTCASISCLTFVKLLPPLSTTVLPLIGKVSPLPTPLTCPQILTLGFTGHLGTCTTRRTYICH